jgi:hypothetical protein
MNVSLDEYSANLINYFTLLGLESTVFFSNCMATDINILKKTDRQTHTHTHTQKEREGTLAMLVEDIQIFLQSHITIELALTTCTE